MDLLLVLYKDSPVMTMEPVLPDYYIVLAMTVNTIKANGFIASHNSGQPRTMICDPPQHFDTKGESTLMTCFHFKTKEFLLKWLDTVFQGQYLPSLSINYVTINKVLEKLPPQLY